MPTLLQPHQREGGKVLQYVTNELVGIVTSTASIPNDNTIPQVGEGVEILSAIITPKSVANELLVRASVSGAHANSYILMALFKDGAANAVSSSWITGNSGGWTPGAGVLTYNAVAGTLAPITFSIRVGKQGGITFYINGGPGAVTFGNSQISRLDIYEISA